MSWCADRRGGLRAAGALSLALACALVSGCYDAHLCGSDEECNLRDDDCDGLVDEGYVDDDGAYRSVEHCGTCGVDCREAFPTAAEVACADGADEEPVCRLIRCADGTHRAGDGACVPDVPVLCLPCSADTDCALRLPGARCLPTETGQSRCGQPCSAMSPCPDGFECDEGREPGSGQCVPLSGICACSAETEGVELACLLESPVAGMRCAGAQRCGAEGPTECQPLLVETCNLQDDDCDGETDEEFRDSEGRYVARLHCGACATPCVEPGPNMVASCLPDGAGVRCDVQCQEDFVDVDRILANGCECMRWDGMGPPPAVGGDSDCDGIPDDTTDFVYVTTAGSDTNPGSLAQPMRTVQAAITRAQAERKSVLVARGIYQGPISLVGGVSVFGGYSPDFQDRDLELFPVLLERTSGDPGLPVLTCRAVTAATRFEGFVVQGSDAVTASAGSTAVLLDGCGEEVRLAEITVLAGRGASGLRGDDSSVNVADWGLSSLTELDGSSGGDGFPGTASDFCPSTPGGEGAPHFCRTVDVSGGDGGAAECPGEICTQGLDCANAGCTDFTVGGVCDIDRVLRLATPNPSAGSGRGPEGGSAGEPSFNAPTNRGVCNFCDDNPTLLRDGGNGGDGARGSDGGGGTGCGIVPMVDGDGRLSGGRGTDGTSGTDGSGGGGGTAGGGYEVILGTDGACGDRSGGSGGGGGSGGCGAPGADGGGGGGYSIGVLVRLAAGRERGPTFENVRVVTASGGRGGDGGVGADGGAGGSGAGGGPGRFWCARTGGRGGDGGRGGAGGGGGGGCGGGSHGVYIVAATGGTAYRDELMSALMIERAGVPGDGGRGGFSPGGPGTDGTDGIDVPIFLSR